MTGSHKMASIQGNMIELNWGTFHDSYITKILQTFHKLTNLDDLHRINKQLKSLLSNINEQNKSNYWKHALLHVKKICTYLKISRDEFIKMKKGQVKINIHKYVTSMKQKRWFRSV